MCDQLWSYDAVNLYDKIVTENHIQEKIGKSKFLNEFLSKNGLGMEFAAL